MVCYSSYYYRGFQDQIRRSSSIRTGGILVLIFSIFGGLNIFALIGGIPALTWKPPRRRVAEAAPPLLPPLS